MKGDGGYPFEMSSEGSGGGGGGGADFECFTPVQAGAWKLQLDRGRRAGDDEGLGFVVGVAVKVAEDEANAVGAVFHLRRGEEARLPETIGVVTGRDEVFGGKVPQWLGEAEGKERDDGGDLGVGANAEHGVAGADDAGAQQSARHGQKAGVGRDEFVAARKSDDLLDGGCGLAVAVDLIEQSVDARLRPEARKLRMIGVDGGKRRFRFRRKGSAFARGAGG